MTGPRLIVLEGIDGAGTTTQAERLGAHLNARGVKVHVTREPSAGPIGLTIRELLKEGVKHVDQTAMALLFAADRLDHWKREMLPAMERGEHVLCDRYVLSSYVYQSRFVPAELVWSVNAQAHPADLTLLLDVPAETAQARRKARGGSQEMYERLQLQRQFVSLYRSVPPAQAERQHLVVLDGRPPADEVFTAVLAHVESCLGLAPGSSST
jgi:dTMP kinase